MTGGKADIARKELASGNASPSVGGTHVWPVLAALVTYLRTMLAFAVVWHLASLWVDNMLLLPTPIAVGQSLWQLLLSGEVAMHVAVSGKRLILSFLLAGAVGIPLGFLMALNQLLFDLVDPVVELLRPISGIAWIPIGLFIFGVGDTLPTAIMFYGAFFPMVINTIVSVRGVDPNLINAARTLGAGRLTILRHVIWPAALPGILVGARLAAGAGWMSMVAAELIGAPSGLGFAVEWYRQLLMTSNVLAFVVVIALLGYAMDRLLRMAQRLSAGWAQPRFET